MSKTEEAVVRGRGRPANFPGEKVAARMYKLPVKTIEMVEQIAAEREQNLGVVLDAMIRRAFNDATRKRSKKTPASTETDIAA